MACITKRNSAHRGRSFSDLFHPNALTRCQRRASSFRLQVFDPIIRLFAQSEVPSPHCSIATIPTASCTLMSPPESSGSSQPKRRRTVEGSCWPCKQRRVKCDLQKPSCRRCINSQTEDCSYDKVLLRWKKRPAKTVPEYQLQPPQALPRKQRSRGSAI